jgi:hypothetical protein
MPSINSNYPYDGCQASCKKTMRIKRFFFRKEFTFRQCSGSLTFCYGSGSGSAAPYLRVTDLDPAPDPALFVSSLQDTNKK